ncbi:aldo/keto reductase [Scopulibacillus cellulosilyticus]|uniref:Aldo/keto reductase n=1 Tax=Scopulibacillus cellulosilyticus TaxID=2665665 RepID=A0ABW2PZN2_9BACL
MANSITDVTTLSNGVKMPWLGFGVFQVEEGETVESAVKHALKTGYRSIDTAAVYGNEKGVGNAIRESGIERDKLFVTTKVWNSAQGYDSTLQAFEESREKLGLDYVDLYLIHWPVEGKYIDTWKAMEKLYHEGKVRAIGVSNFHEHHLQDLMKNTEVKPMVNQIELHPHLNQEPLRNYCKENDIQVEAWSPLAQGKVLSDSVITKIADKYGKSPAQVVIRWDLQNGIVTIPKSVTPHRIEENANVFDFELTNEEMNQINAVNKDERTGPDPDNFDF